MHWGGDSVGFGQWVGFLLCQINKFLSCATAKHINFTCINRQCCVYSPFYILLPSKIKFERAHTFINPLSLHQASKHSVSLHAPCPPSTESCVNTRARTPSRRYRPAAAFRFSTQTKSERKAYREKHSRTFSKVVSTSEIMILQNRPILTLPQPQNIYITFFAFQKEMP